jgi:DNA-binding MarR family transcriptional regulator
MPDLDAAVAADELLGMTTLFRAMVERRHARPPGEPTRLQQFLLASIHRPEGITLSELAPLLDVSAATASQMVGTLEARGWVERGLDPTDRRRHVVRLTDSGAAAIDRAEARRRERLLTMLQQLSGEERWELVRLAQRVAAIVVTAAGESSLDSGDTQDSSKRGGGS